jgi:hypothetical protein
VEEWLAGREARAQKRQERAAAPGAERPPDREAQLKRAAARESRIQEGLEELSAFLRDMLRQGLAAVPARPESFFETPAARLVDAQAGGLGRLVQRLARIAASGEGWQSRLLAEIGRIQLIVQAYRNISRLAGGAQEELRSLVGWTQSQDELLATSGIAGTWIIAGQTVDHDKRLTTQRTWLIERDSARPALSLTFAAGSAPLDRSLVVGCEIEAELVSYPAAAPLRALVKSRRGAPCPARAMPGCTIGEALARHADALANSPWLDDWPMALRSVVPLLQNDRWSLRDTAGAVLGIDPRFDKGWELCAVAGGKGVDVFGEWNGHHFRPMAAVADGEFVTLAGGSRDTQAA